ncbi:MAG: hypothetical protein V3S20_03270 [Dehalococcoidia bacterium]
MNETNRTAIVLLGALWIVLMAVVIFAAWAADTETVERLQDFVAYLDNHRDNASRLILTLGALVLIVLSLLVIIVELAPEEEEKQISVEQAGATTIVPAEPLRLRLEEALTAMPQITAARARVFSRDKGVGMKLDLTVLPNTNIAAITQEATRVVTETLQSDLGLPVSSPPTVRIAFGSQPAGEPAASSVVQPPTPPPAEQPTAPPAGPPPSPGERPFPWSAAPATPSADEPAPEANQPAATPGDVRPYAPPPPASAPKGTPPAGESAPQDETQHDEPQQH